MIYNKDLYSFRLKLMTYFYLTWQDVWFFLSLDCTKVYWREMWLDFIDPNIINTWLPELIYKHLSLNGGKCFFRKFDLVHIDLMNNFIKHHGIKAACSLIEWVHFAFNNDLSIREVERWHSIFLNRFLSWNLVCNNSDLASTLDKFVLELHELESNSCNEENIISNQDRKFISFYYEYSDESLLNVLEHVVLYNIFTALWYQYFGIRDFNELNEIYLVAILRNKMLQNGFSNIEFPEIWPIMHFMLKHNKQF